MLKDVHYTIDAADAKPIYWVAGPLAIETQYASYQAYFKAQGFIGKAGQTCVLSDRAGVTEAVFVGIGEESLSTALSIAASSLPEGKYRLQESYSEDVLIYWALAQYSFQSFKVQNLPSRVLVVTPAHFSSLKIMREALYLVRDLINQPANVLTPEHFAEQALALGRSFGATATVWTGEELLEEFPAVYTVGKASASAPRMVCLSNGDPKHPLVALVGKGVCFDSGGLDIKTGSSMLLMKKDMGGAAHALGLAHWIWSLNLPIHLMVWLPIVENAIGSNAMRPSDIIRMRNGLTVEIDNTDAEGRLILADALTAACEKKPELLIDFATLTGAARVALGPDISAFFSNDAVLAKELLQASEATRDPLWQLPLFAPYKAFIDSKIADTLNSGGSGYAGAIVAALFLQFFVPNNIPWVHFDMMAWNLTDKPGKPMGGEAMALRAVMHYLQGRFGSPRLSEKKV
ncbi:MAG: leucyl aminopeptidase family protein [Legionellaceae bacterium]|nr:leucyl aminopeptidase family protein [Legionellaceae bacterium]